MTTGLKDKMLATAMTALVSVVVSKAASWGLDRGGEKIRDTLARAKLAAEEKERKKRALAEQAGKSMEIRDTHG